MFSYLEHKQMVLAAYKLRGDLFAEIQRCRAANELRWIPRFQRALNQVNKLLSQAHSHPHPVLLEFKRRPDDLVSD